VTVSVVPRRAVKRSPAVPRYRLVRNCFESESFAKFRVAIEIFEECCLVF